MGWVGGIQDPIAVKNPPSQSNNAVEVGAQTYHPLQQDKKNLPAPLQMQWQGVGGREKQTDKCLMKRYEVKLAFSASSKHEFNPRACTKQRPVTQGLLASSSPLNFTRQTSYTCSSISRRHHTYVSPWTKHNRGYLLMTLHLFPASTSALKTLTARSESTWLSGSGRCKADGTQINFATNPQLGGTHVSARNTRNIEHRYDAARSPTF